MSKFKKPTPSTETSILDNITSAAEKTGAKFINTVEQACEQLATAVVGTIEGMVQSAVDTATGLVDTATGLVDKASDALSGAYDSVEDLFSGDTPVPGDEDFSEFLEDFDEEAMYEASLEENCNLQSTMLEDATEKCNNLSAKEVKTLSENANASKQLSSSLAQSGADKVKGTVLNG